jgi:SAM-dependent methyltransferase
MLNFEIQIMKDLLAKPSSIIKRITPEDLITETTISEEDEMSVAYLFRPIKKCRLWNKSIRTRQRKVLDVGCGAGSHSLLQNELSLEVTAIDISSNAIQACSLRGIKDARVQDVMTLENETYDTILLLMNGAGMWETKKYSEFPTKTKITLKSRRPNFIRQSDIIYMFDDEDGGKWIPSDNEYYGEVVLTLPIKAKRTPLTGCTSTTTHYKCSSQWPTS